MRSLLVQEEEFCGLSVSTLSTPQEPQDQLIRDIEFWFITDGVANDDYGFVVRLTGRSGDLKNFHSEVLRSQ